MGVPLAEGIIAKEAFSVPPARLISWLKMFLLECSSPPPTITRLPRFDG
jgi:hypothetical protein